MAAKTRSQLNTRFKTGDKPTQQDFIDLFQSFFSLEDDNYLKVDGLADALSYKVNVDQFNNLSNLLGSASNLKTESKTLIPAINELFDSLAENGTGTGVFTESFVVNLPDNRTGIPNGTPVNAGDPIASFLKAAFRKASPAVYSQPTVGLNANKGTGNIEVGTLFDNLTLTGTFNKGDAGDKISERIIKNGTTLEADNSTTELNLQITETTQNYQYEVTYAQGVVRNDTLGTPDPSGQIPAGTKVSGTLSFVGYRQAFAGFNAGDPRAFPHAIFNPGNGSQVTVNVPAGAARVRIVYPASLRDFNKTNGSKVTYVEDSNKDITDNFVQVANINVAGANNYAPIAYKVAEFVPVEPFPSAVTYIIKI